MPNVAEAVRGLQEEDAEWKSKFFFALGRVYDDCEEPDNALKILNDALPLAQAPPDSHLETPPSCL